MTEHMLNKRLVSAIFISVLLLSSTLSATTLAPSNKVATATTLYPWPMFGYDAANTGYTPSPGPKTNLTLWKRGGLGYWVVSTPAVVDGIVYVGTDWGTKRLYALDATDGTVIWSYETGGCIKSSPAVANGIVYVGSDDGYLYALDATTGAKIWHYRTGSPEYTSPVRSSPAVVDGVVYVGTEAYSVYALDAITGAKMWEYRTGSLVYSSPAVSNGIVYIGSCDDNLYALNANLGTKMWSYKTGGNVYSSPAVSNGIVYIGSWDGYLYALDAVNGTLIWKYQTGKLDSYNSLAVSNGIVYVGSDNGMVYALNAITGAKIWDYPTKGEIESSPAVADGIVYIGSDDNNLYALDATTGAEIWVYSSGGNMYRLSVADGIVFVGSYAYEGGYALYAIGRPLRPQSPTADFTFSPLKPLPNQTVTFDASASEPGWNGTHEMPIVSYEWDFGDGYRGEGRIVDHAYAAEGSYTVALKVTDSQGLWNAKSKMITVLLPPPYRPMAKFFYLPYVPSVNRTLTFYISDSMPGWNGTHNVPIANYTWDFGDGNITTTPNSVITHIYAAVGTYTVNLTVTCQDDPVLIEKDLASSSTWRDITVQLEPKFTETTVYLNPATITATSVGQNFTVEVCIANVTDLYTFGCGMTWDPDALECVDFEDGPFLTGGVWTVDYINISGTINNTAGEIYPPYYIGRRGSWNPGITGSGTIFIAKFTAKKTGTFNVHPAEVVLISSEVIIIPANVLDVFTVVQEESVYPIVTVSSLTGRDFNPPRIRIYNYGFNQTAKAISFEVTGEPGETGFCNVTIPNDLLEDNPPECWVVVIDGSNAPSTISQNATHISIYFTYTLSSHDVVIKASTLKPTADYTFSPEDPGKGETVTFDASGSEAATGYQITNYTWDWNGTSQTMTYPPSTTTTHSFTTGGDYTVGLRVGDTSGAYSDWFNRTVPVGYPHANFSWTPVAPLPNDTVTFNATQSPWGTPWRSSDKDDTITSYKWDPFNNGTDVGYGATFNYTYLKAGTYTMKLTVTDSDGQTSSTIRTVEVLWEHDVAVTNVTLSMICSELYGVHPIHSSYISPVVVHVTVRNEGYYNETFNVTAYYDNHAIETQTVDALPPQTSKNLTFNWYAWTHRTFIQLYVPITFSANASIVQGEVDTADNTLIDGTVTVWRTGDANGDGHCDGYDYTWQNICWLTTYPGERYSWHPDFNGDGSIDGFDWTYINVNWLTY